MALWSDILKELNDFNEKNKRPGFDEIRRKYLNELYKITSRNTIFYATSWIDPKNHPGTDINVSDIQGFMEVVGELQGDELDLILHSPGGSAEATGGDIKLSSNKIQRYSCYNPVCSNVRCNYVIMWCK